MLTQWFILPINPEPWAIGTTGVTKASGKARGFISPNAQLDNYKKAVRTQIEQWYPNRRFVDTECSLAFFFFRRLDKYEGTNGRGNVRHVADVTNLQKATEDAIQGVVIANDRLVRRITSEMVEQSFDTDPGVVFSVTSGSFKSAYEEQLWHIGAPQEVRDMFAAMQDERSVLDLGNLL